MTLWSSFTADNEHAEAQFVVSTIMAAMAAGANWRDHAVLLPHERAVKPTRIRPSSATASLTESSAVRALTALRSRICSRIRVSLLPGGRSAYFEDHQRTRKGASAQSLSTPYASLQANGCPMFEILDKADDYPELQRSAIKLRNFANFIKELREYAKTATPDALYDELLCKGPATSSHLRPKGHGR